MRGCPDRKDEIARYVAGDLPQSRIEALRAHIEACRDCEGALESARALEAHLADPPLVRPSPGFADRVLAAIDRLEEEDVLLARRLREIARRRRAGSLLDEPLPAALLAAAALAVGFPLSMEISRLVGEISLRLGSLLPVLTGNVLAVLGARGDAWNATYAYPAIVLIALAFGLLHALGLERRLGVFSP